MDLDEVAHYEPPHQEPPCLQIQLFSSLKNDLTDIFLPYLFGYKTGLSLSRMSTNNQINPMQFCCNTGFTLPKQSQRSRSVL